MSTHLRKKEKQTGEFRAVIKAINRCLEGDWSKNQLKKGMMFEIREYWMSFYGDLRNQYRTVGWSVKTHVELTPGKRRVFLNIQHPMWVNKDDRGFSKT